MPETIQNVTIPSAAQPTVRQNGARRRPKCAGCGRSVREANRTAVATKIPSSTAVSTSVAAVPSLPPDTAAITAPAIVVATSPDPKAAGPYQAGQRGNPLTPAGRSGGSGGGGCGNAYPYPCWGP